MSTRRPADAAAREAARRRSERASRQPPPAPEPTPLVAAAADAGNNRWDALRALGSNARALHRAEVKQGDLVLAARATGATWTQIARTLGVSPQAVQQRYGAPSTSGRS